MAFSRVQGTGKIRVDGGTSIALTFASPPSVGNAVIVPVLVSGTKTWVDGVCTDNRGNTYTMAIQRAGEFTNSCAIFFCKRVGTTGAPFTVTVAPAFGTADFVGGAIEFGGVDGELAVHKTSTQNSMSTDPNTGALPTVTIADTIDVIAMTIGVDQASIAVEAGWTQEFEELTATPYFPCEADYRIHTVAPTLHVTWTCATSGWWATCRALFNAQPYVPPPVTEGVASTVISAGVVTSLVQGKVYSLPRVIHVTSTSSLEVSMDGTTFSPLTGAETVGARTSMRYIRTQNASCIMIAKFVERLPIPS